MQALVSVAANGAKLGAARIIAADPKITDTFAEGVASIFAGKDPDAIAWASEHAAELLLIDGSGGELVESTRNMIRQTITTLLQDPYSDIPDIAKALQDAYAFSPERAELIAATELHNAQEQGGYRGAVQVGCKFKKWLLSNDEGVCTSCAGNAAQGWIPIELPFASGAMAPLEHGGCRCGAVYRRVPR